MTQLEKRLAMFERKILRRIFETLRGSVLELRLRLNKEVLDGPDTMQYIMCRRLHLAGLIVRMDNSRIRRKVLDEEFHGRRPLGRPQLRWKDSMRG